MFSIYNLKLFNETKFISKLHSRVIKLFTKTNFIELITCGKHSLFRSQLKTKWLSTRFMNYKSVKHKVSVSFAKVRSEELSIDKLFV